MISTASKSTSAAPEASSSFGSFYVTGGTLPFSAPSYVTRSADAELYESLKAAQFCYVLNTRQIGKSSLMIRTVNRLRADNAGVVVLDLTAIGQNLTVEQWYDGLLVMLAEQLSLEDACEDFWQENRERGPMQRFFAAIKEVVLPVLEDRRLIVFVDEIDSVRSLPFPVDEFFAGIRECYNRRAQDAAYDRVTFCLLGVATPADLIKDTRLSPFNIGKRISMHDFTVAEAAPLAHGMGVNGRALLERVLHWTGGHPYLTQRLCREISHAQATSIADVDALTRQHFLSKRALDTDDNLSFVRSRLLRSEYPLPDVLELYRKIRRGRRVKNDETNPLCGLLLLAGIVTADEHTEQLRLRNRIYAAVFDDAWVQSNTPDTELRRQRQAAFIARWQVGSVATVVVIALSLLLVKLARTAERAQMAAEDAQREQQRALSQQRKAEENEHRAGIAEATSEQRRQEAERSASDAKRNSLLAQKNALAAKNSEARARIGESRARDATRLALEEKERADKAAQSAKTSAAQAGMAKDDALRQKEIAEQQRKIAEQLTEEAREQKQFAEQQKGIAEQQRELALDNEHKARDSEFQARKAKEQAETSLERLSDANKRRIEYLKQSIRNNSNVIASAVELAYLYMQLASIYDEVEFRDNAKENYAEAAKAFGVVLARRPEDVAALTQRGYCYLKLQEYDAAITDFTAAINRQPQDAGTAYLNRAVAYRAVSKPSLALQDLAMLERIDPRQMDYILRGQCLMDRKNYEGAITAFTMVLRKPNPAAAAEAYAWIGDAYRADGKYDQAYQNYTRYQELHPDNKNVYQLRVQCLLANKRWHDVTVLCRKYRQLFPRTAVMYPWHAYALLNLNQENEYRALCQEALERFGTPSASAENANSAAWTCALGKNAVSNYAEPLRIARQAVSVNEKQDKTGDDPLGELWASRNTLAALLYRAGKNADAIQVLDQCATMPRSFSPDNRFSDYILYAMIYARIGNQKGALEYWQRVKALPRSTDMANYAEQGILLKEAANLLEMQQARSK